MSIKPKEQNINELFSINKQYYIDFYQRDYKWRREHIEKLLEDLLYRFGLEYKTGEKGVFTMVDDLTRRIKANFNLTREQIASDVDREVGKITEKISNRFVKYATEISFLTKGTEKRLTDSGRLFKMYHETDFFITQNKGQLILFILALAEKDEFMFRALIQKLHKEKKISKSDQSLSTSPIHIQLHRETECTDAQATPNSD